MAKKLRKQISRALKRRFTSFEKDLVSTHAYHVNECSHVHNKTCKQLSASYLKYCQKMLIVVMALCLFVALLVSFSSCNVTRVVTTSSEYFQRGDTSCMIQTKTVETYDATKKL